MYINLDALNLDEIADELYDFSTRGVVAVPNVIGELPCSLLHYATQQHQEKAKKASEKHGKATQDFESIYYEPIGMPPETAIRFIIKEYRELYNSIGERAGFSGEPNSLGMHFYPKGGSGISPHQDYAREKNLIASIVLRGNTPFGVCDDHDKTNATYFDAQAGSIVFMRAARTIEEQSARPFHFVEGPLEQDRCVLLFRYSPSRDA